MANVLRDISLSSLFDDNRPVFPSVFRWEYFFDRMAPKSKEKAGSNKTAGGQLKKKKTASAPPAPKGGGGSDKRFEFSTASGLLRSLPELCNLIASDVSNQWFIRKFAHLRF